jgi:hypothetical protein
MYIMKRTQLYLDDESWQALRISAEQAGTTISELVRQAVRDKYATSPAARSRAMRAFVGLWKGRTDFGDATAYVRALRRGRRLRRVAR